MHVTPVFAQNAFRGEQSWGTQSTHNWITDLDTNWVQPVAATATNEIEYAFRLRVLVAETAGGVANNRQIQLQRSLNGGAFGNVSATSTIIQSAVNSNLTNGAATTQQIGAGTYVITNDGVRTTDAVTSNVDYAGNDEAEILYSLNLRPADVAEGDAVSFRVLVNGSTITYNVTPAITVTYQHPALMPMRGESQLLRM